MYSLGISQLLAYADIKFDMTLDLWKTRSKSKCDEVGYVMDVESKYIGVSKKPSFFSVQRKKPMCE